MQLVTLLSSSKPPPTLGKPLPTQPNLSNPLTPTSFIVFYSWISTSFPRPPAKRAVAIALVNAFSQLGNVAGSYVWDLTDNGYRKSYGIVTAMFGFTIIGCFVFKLVLEGLNKKLAEAEVADVSAGRPVADVVVNEDADESLRMHKGFRYLT